MFSLIINGPVVAKFSELLVLEFRVTLKGLEGQCQFLKSYF